MPYYEFPDKYDQFARDQAVAFCLANDINPKAPVLGSTFEVRDTTIIIRELVLSNGARVHHDGCCGSAHFAKATGMYDLRVAPERFGFQALLDSAGNVAP